MADPFAALSAAITMAGTGIATACAEKVVGGATVGAMAEKPDLFGRGLILMVVPETNVVFGVVIALQLLSKVGAPYSARDRPRNGNRGRPRARSLGVRVDPAR